MYYFVNKERQCQICTYFVWFYFILLVCAHFRNQIEKIFLWPMKNDIRFEYVPLKNVLFCFISIIWIHFSLKTEKFRFTKRHWNALIIFDKKRYDVRFEYVPWKNVWFCFICIVWVHFSHRTEKLQFWKLLKYFLIKNKLISDLNLSCQILFDLV